MVNFRRIDLNLLATLDVLLTELNVTRAAQRLNLSQPSVSVQLARLREIFDDPLLLPGPRGMQPTARADALRVPLRQALDALESAVSSGSAFDPASADLTWKIAATDYTESAVVLPALNSLRAAAPGTRLALFELNPAQILRQAEQGDVDLIFHIREGAHLSCGDLWLCLSLDAQRYYIAPQESDYTHYAFSLDENDFAAFVARLTQAGVTSWKENKSEGASFYFLDPDGHKLEAHVGSLAQRLAACRAKPYKGMVFFDGDAVP